MVAQKRQTMEQMCHLIDKKGINVYNSKHWPEMTIFFLYIFDMIFFIYNVYVELTPLQTFK